ncbi:MAG: ATP-binding cassette domain-containing protein [Anaerolineae bacterium]
MIETVGLTKRFGDLVAVDDVTLTVAPGEVLALLGPNGAGKTTTVRMLSSILKPTCGWARVAGYDVVTEGHEVRRRVGVLTEAPGLYTRMTGWEYLTFFGQLRGFPAEALTSRIRDLAKRFRVIEALPRRLGEYSKGMRQKIALLRTLLHDPPVLLFDEPTSAMDPESARLVRDSILQMRGSQRRALIVCTHNLTEAEELSDRIAIIRQGRIVALGTPAELKSRFLGPPLMELRVATQAGRASVDMHNGVRQVVEQFGTVEQVGNEWIRYRTPDPAAANPRLLTALSGADIPVMMLSAVPQSLEQVYLRVMEGDPPDG